MSDDLRPRRCRRRRRCLLLRRRRRRYRSEKGEIIEPLTTAGSAIVCDNNETVAIVAISPILSSCLNSIGDSTRDSSSHPFDRDQIF